ncbi:hypothetical protein AJ78_00294 [Emergomyces pasteurianus Ep9510]|uniref:Uncharacterized protein n=1 Tax=Emergomyces pasteurianus Ep9510 TaxID=1447872 RepID=A0A1J9PV78_9EURO|nr:hypothetical protein AJ78_00294 [Emergomyces pasteurianus Ep9510]
MAAFTKAQNTWKYLLNSSSLESLILKANHIFFSGDRCVEEVILELLGSEETEPLQRKKLLSLWNNEASSEKLHEAWKSSELRANVEELLSSPALTSTGPSCIEDEGGSIEPEDSVSDLSSDLQLGGFSDYHIEDIPPWALTQTRYT